MLTTNTCVVSCPPAWPLRLKAISVSLFLFVDLLKSASVHANVRTWLSRVKRCLQKMRTSNPNRSSC